MLRLNVAFCPLRQSCANQTWPTNLDSHVFCIKSGFNIRRSRIGNFQVHFILHHITTENTKIAQYIAYVTALHPAVRNFKSLFPMHCPSANWSDVKKGSTKSALTMTILWRLENIQNSHTFSNLKLFNERGEKDSARRPV